MKKTLICLLCLFALPSFAKGYSPAVTARAGGYDVKYASNGTPLAVPVTPGVGGVPQISSPVSIPLPGGINYPITAASVISAASLLTPWGSAIGLALTAGSIGVAVLDAVLQNAKIRVKPGGGSLEAEDPNACAANCFEYRIYEAAWSRDPVTACRAGYANYQAVNPGDTTLVFTGMYSATICGGYKQYAGGGTYPNNAGLEQRNAAPNSGSYVPISTADAAAVLTARSPSAAEVQALVDLGFPPVPELPVLTGPASVFKGNVVQLGLDGTVTEIEERYIASFNPGVIGIGVEKKQTVTTPQKVATTTTTNPDGSQSIAVTTTPQTSSTISTISPIPVEKADPITCGLPGTPACRLDETGTATGSGQTFDPTKTAIDAAKTSAESNISGAASIGAPAWSFAFQLPTGCAPYVTGIKGVVLNVCQYQSTIHGLLSAIWAAATAFAMIGMVGRTIRES